MPATPTSLPALEGVVYDYYDGRYRLYTVEHLPFDALPSYADGGPPMVTAGGWGVSTSSLCAALSSPSAVAEDDEKCTLNAYRCDGAVGPTKRHPLDGSKYDTQRDADRAAYEAGLLAFMVYERDAARHGLPVSD